MDSARLCRSHWAQRRRGRRGRSHPPLPREPSGAYQNLRDPNLEYPGFYASPLNWNGVYPPSYPPPYGPGRSYAQARGGYAPTYPLETSILSSSSESLPVGRRQSSGMETGYVPPALAGDTALMAAPPGGQIGRRGRSCSRRTYRQGVAPAMLAGGQSRGLPMAAAYGQPVLADSYLPPPKNSRAGCPPRAAAAAAYGLPVAPVLSPSPTVEETVIEETFLTSGDKKGRRSRGVSRNLELEKEISRSRSSRMRQPEFDAVPLAGAYLTAAAAVDSPRKKKKHHHHHHHHYDRKSRYMAPEVTLSEVYLIPAAEGRQKHKKKHHRCRSKARVIGYISKDPEESSSSDSSSDSDGPESEMITWEKSTRPRGDYVSPEEDAVAETYMGAGAAHEKKVRRVKKILRKRYNNAGYDQMQPAVQQIQSNYQPPFYYPRGVGGYNRLEMAERGLNPQYPLTWRSQRAFPQGYGQEGLYANIPSQRGNQMPGLPGGNCQYGLGNAALPRATLEGQRGVARQFL